MSAALFALVYVCALSLFCAVVLPPLSKTKLILRFLPQDVREAAKAHPDPPANRRALGYLLTGLFAATYLGALALLGWDGLRHGCGFWGLYGRYLLFLYGYKLFDILVQDRYLVVRRKYYLRFFPETKDCEGWNDCGFNRRRQLVRLLAFPFVGALLAWLTLLIGA